MATFSNQYVEPGVYVETELTPVPTVGTAGPFITCLVGTVDPYTNVSSTITRSASGQVDNIVYADENVNYADIDISRNIVVSNPNIGRTYNASELDFPVPETPIVGSGGTLTAGTYYYTVVAIRDDGIFSDNPLYTESEQIKVVIASGTTNGSVSITISPVANATKYRLYGRSDGAPTGYIEVSAPTVTLVDTGASLIAGGLPSVKADYHVFNAGTNAAIRWTKSSRRAIPGANSTYTITFYKMKRADEYNPIFYYSGQEQAAYKVLGEVTWDSVKNEPAYSLPLGFQLAMANGASGVWCVPMKATDSVSDILTKIENLTNPLPYTIVFLKGYIHGSSSPNLTDGEATSILSHVLSMSSITEQKERIAIFGPYVNAYSSSDIVDKYTNTVSLLKSRRTVYLYPSNILVQIGSSQHEVSGFYLGAALGGLLDSLALNSSVSGQVIAGVSGVTDDQMRVIKNQIAGKGTCIIENTYRIRHALTTDMTTVLTREIKTTRIIDYITRLVRDSLASFTNVTSSGSILSSIGATVKLLLSQLVNANVLEDYRDIKVSKNTTDANQVDVSYVFRPQGDINWIYVKQSVEA